MRRARRVGAAEEERASHHLPAGDAAPRLAGRTRGGAQGPAGRHGLPEAPFTGYPDGGADRVGLRQLPVVHRRCGDVLVAVLDAPDVVQEAYGGATAGEDQIRDIVVERDIGFKEARRQDCLVQRKLSKSLGHSSRCLYALLLFYLYGTVRDVELHISKRLSGKGEKNVTVHAAKFLINGDELAVRSGVKQLSHALGVFRFVWEAANADSGTDNDKDVIVKKNKGMDANGVLKLQGHLWGFGVEQKVVTYRGDVFHVHQIQLP